EKALAQRTERNEANSQLLERWQHVRFRLSPPQRILALDGSNGLDRVCATYRLHAGFRKPEVLDLTLVNQVLHCSCDVFDGHIRVNTVLIEEVDRVNLERLEPLERSFGDLLDVRWPTVQAPLPAGFEFEPELCRDHHLIAQRGERFAYELFIGERAIGFCRVEERHAAFDGRANQRDHLLLVRIICCLSATGP